MQYDSETKELITIRNMTYALMYLNDPGKGPNVVSERITKTRLNPYFLLKR